jgi:hypothetical protein
MLETQKPLAVLHPARTAVRCPEGHQFFQVEGSGLYFTDYPLDSARLHGVWSKGSSGNARSPDVEFYPITHTYVWKDRVVAEGAVPPVPTAAEVQAWLEREATRRGARVLHLWEPGLETRAIEHYVLGVPERGVWFQAVCAFTRREP